MHLKKRHAAPHARTNWKTLKSALQTFAFLLLAFTARGQAVENILSTGLFEPYGIAISPGNLYYITDSANNRIVVFNPNSLSVTNLAGQAGANGKGAIDSTNGLAARFYSPQGIVYTSIGLVIADSGNNLIRLVDFNGGVTTLLGDIRTPRDEHANNLPIDNAGTDDGPGLNAAVNAPSGLAVESPDTVLIADQLNGTIRRLHLSGDHQVSTLMVKDGATTNLVPAKFTRPTAIAVSANGLFIADSGRHSIYKLIENDSIVLVAGSGTAFVSGYKDDIVPTNALFKNPSGLYVDDSRGELLISDSGNGMIRRLVGLGTGSTKVDTLSTDTSFTILKPVGIVRDQESIVVFADLDANAIKGLRQTASQPPVSPPKIGVITLDTVNGCFQMSPITNATFFNEVLLGILGEPNTATYFVVGPDPATVPDPNVLNGSAPPNFSDCMTAQPENLLNRIPSRTPRMTIRAIGTAANRKSSTITQADVLFQVAPVSIVAADATAVSFNTVTTDVTIYYTSGISNTIAAPTPSTGILYKPGTILNLYDDRNDITVKAIAYKNNYRDAEVTTRLFQKVDAKRSVVGVPRDFTAGVGSTIVVPMTLDVAPSNTVRTLQYRVEISPKSGSKTTATPVPRLLSVSSSDLFSLNFSGTNLAEWSPYTRTNGTVQGMAVFFLHTNASFVVTNAVTVAVMALEVPPTAAVGDQYAINILKPTGTSDGVDTPVALVAGPEHTLKIANRVYTVGDVAPATWYNLGDFGSADPTVEPLMENNDVLLAFRASLGISVPYQFTDIYDAMDAFPVDKEGEAGGDGLIRYQDYQTILRRSLGLEDAIWQRSWTADGTRTAHAFFGGSPLETADKITPKPKTAVTPTIVWAKDAMIYGTSSHGTQGHLANVPIYLNVRKGRHVAGMQFTARVSPLGSNPAVSSINFVSALAGSSPTTLGTPGAVSVAWNLGSISPIAEGDTLVGYVQFTVPSTAFTGQQYLVQFSNADGAPDISTQYDFETSRTFVNVSTDTNVADDNISDEWKVAFFGSVDAPQATANADPDGDGVSNLTEFGDGTNPLRNDFKLEVVRGQNAGSNLILQWFGASGLNYSVEGSPTLKKDWTPVAASSISGQGGMLQFTNQNSTAFQFYRVRIVP